MQRGWNDGVSHWDSLICRANAQTYLPYQFLNKISMCLSLITWVGIHCYLKKNSSDFFYPDEKSRPIQTSSWSSWVVPGRSESLLHFSSDHGSGSLGKKARKGNAVESFTAGEIFFTHPLLSINGLEETHHLTLVDMKDVRMRTGKTRDVKLISRVNIAIILLLKK